MKKHILLEKAKRYEVPKDIKQPSNYMFDNQKGYWFNSVSNTKLMESDDKRREQSKKCDIETGEDQKGE